MDSFFSSNEFQKKALPALIIPESPKTEPKSKLKMVDNHKPRPRPQKIAKKRKREDSHHPKDQASTKETNKEADFSSLFKGTDDPERLARTIFVGNVHVSTERKELKKLFKTYGPIESVRIRSIPSASQTMSRKASAITKDFHDQTSCFNAYVVFKTPESASAALALNQTEFKERHLKVDAAENPKSYDNALSVFVGNIPFNADEEKLRALFQSCGVSGVRLIRDHKTNIGKGFGYVQFDNESGVKAAMALSPSEKTLQGRVLRLQKWTSNLEEQKSGLKKRKFARGNPSGRGSKRFKFKHDRKSSSSFVGKPRRGPSGSTRKQHPNPKNKPHARAQGRKPRKS